MKNKFFVSALVALTLASCGGSNPETSVRAPSVYDVYGDAGEVVANAFGGWDLPLIEADEVLAEPGVDEFGDNYLFLYAFYEEDTAEDFYNVTMSNYAYSCMKQGYDIEYKTIRTMDENYVIYEFPCYFADIHIDDKVGLELQILEGAYHGRECIGIYAFTYPLCDGKSWPTNFIEKITDKEVVEPDQEETYSYYAELGLFSDDGTPFCYIYIEGMLEEDIEAYVQKLAINRYVVMEDEDEYGCPIYFAYDQERDHIIQFGYDYNQYLGSYFYIYNF